MPPRRRRADEDEEPPETSRWLYIGFLALICGSGLPVILPVIDVVLDWLGSSGYTQFSPSDETLPQAFFGGHPWVLYCRKDKEDLPNLWTATAKKHVQSEDVGMFSMGVLDCSAAFKSGKNTYERFKLKPPEYSHAIFCANGSPPTLLPWDWNINDPKPAEIQAVLTQVKTKTKPISRMVSTTASLTDYCTNNKKCALVLHNASLDDEARKVLDSLMNSYRLVKWVRVDIATRFVSLEKSLPPLVDAPPNEPRLIFFKRDPEAKTKALAAKAHKGLFSVNEVSEFLDDCINQSGEGSPMSPLKHSPYITKRSAKKASDKPKSEAKKEAKQDSKPRDDRKQDDSRKQQQQQENKEKRERERKERERREEQASEAAEEAEEEEAGEETIDLDEDVREEV